MTRNCVASSNLLLHMTGGLQGPSLINNQQQAKELTLGRLLHIDQFLVFSVLLMMPFVRPCTLKWEMTFFYESDNVTLHFVFVFLAAFVILCIYCKCTLITLFLDKHRLQCIGQWQTAES